MTERELLHYEMNREELKKWNELVDDIKSKFLSMSGLTKIPYALFTDTLDRTTMAKEPWCGSKGYIKDSGFYYVEEGDRGKIELIYSGLDYKMARNEMVKRCADRIAYAYVTKDIKGLRDKYKGLWHYCRIDDGIENVNGITRMKSHLEEQKDWVYDAEYDYRIYWFEPLIFMVRRILDNKEYEKTIAYYEECMNHNMKKHHWVFNRELEKFELL
ncbi:MAG: hypothetical protein K2J91_02205 [Lachnospiraceae bacterium]|nr:hypothetical protein [Lachnospiraceae bacterium]